MTGEIESRGLDAILKSLGGAEKIAAKVAERALPQCGAMVVATAVLFAPRSPTKAEFSRTLKRKKETSRRSFHPGGLEKSIESAVEGDRCVVFVRANSFAGKYAKRIHDERGETWHNRGPGTIAKGQQAREKFIERAVDEHERNGDIDRIFAFELDKALKEAK